MLGVRPGPGEACSEPPVMRFCICQTMMSSQGHPSKRTEARRENPSIHNVIDPPRRPIGRCGGNLSFRDRARCPCLLEEFLVEPDGIEPTTSCLQSTRSTN